MSVNSKMTEIANAIRTKTGGTAKLNLDQMASAIASIESGGGGGLPDGIKKIACGTVTPSSDGNTLVVDHDLGEAPNFCLWEIVGTDFSSSTGSSLAVAGSSFECDLKNSSTSSVVYNLNYMIRGYSSSGALNGTTASVVNSSYMTTTEFTMVGNSSYKIKSGYTYRWICGVLEV